ncbi:MAG: AAA family ATPase [Halothiobacillaceae bacterium]
MLQRLELNNLTVFQQADLRFAPGLNVIVGENGLGKTHLLKLIYALISTSTEMGRNPNASSPNKSALQKAYADKLIGVFRPDALGRLVARKQGRARCEVALAFEDSDLNTACSFATNAKTEVQVDRLPQSWGEKPALFLPTRELMTIFPGFVALYDSHYVPFEESWRDTCVHLGFPPLKGRRSAAIASLLEPLEEAMGGKVVMEKSGHFYLHKPGSGKMEMYLVAEGLRKLAMLAQLIGNGTLQQQGYLFWDEPETNLNPRLIRLVARVIHQLAAHGVQVFIATHNYFLLKELDLLWRDEPVDQALFSIVRENDAVAIQCADRLTALGEIVGSVPSSGVKAR